MHATRQLFFSISTARSSTACTSMCSHGNLRWIRKAFRCRVAHSSQDRHERRFVREHPVARDRIRQHARTSGTASRTPCRGYASCRPAFSRCPVRASCSIISRARHALGNRDQRANGNAGHNLAALGVDRPRCRWSRAIRSNTPSPIPICFSRRPTPGRRYSRLAGARRQHLDMIAAQRARGLGVGCCPAATGRGTGTRRRFRVYEDPADLLRHIDEVAARS